MSVADRRAVLRLAGLAALAPLVTTGVRTRAAPSRAFRPPLTPLRYTRTLVRGLADGAAIRVSRSFAVAFAPQDYGYSLSGKQVAVEVDAPERIASLAAIERRRPETGLFPMQLDSSGMIVGGPEARSAKELDAAIAEARRLLAEQTLQADERNEAEAFVRMVHGIGIALGAQLPRDLFAPIDDHRSETRDVPLPNAGHGEVKVMFTAETDPGTGLMRQARRAIVTSVDGNSRTTREDWTLGPI